MKAIIAALIAFGGLFSLGDSRADTVWVDIQAKDSIGQRLGYLVRDGIRRSAGMSLADREVDAVITLDLVSVDLSDVRPGVRSAYSAVWAVRAKLPDPCGWTVAMPSGNTVDVCPAVAVDECAQDLVAKADRLISDMKARGDGKRLIQR